MTIHETTQAAFDQLAGHVGHHVQLEAYGKGGKPPWVGLALECQECDAVIADWSVNEKGMFHQIKGYKDAKRVPKRKVRRNRQR
jgi:hypothetical protein